MTQERSSSEGRPGDLNRKKNHLISRRKFRQFIETDPGSQKDKPTFDHFCKTVEQAIWMKHSDIKETFGTADRVGRRVVFDVGGNKYRVVADVIYEKGKTTLVLVRHVLTHKEYDDGQWKSLP